MEVQKEGTENKMGVMPVNRLLLSMSVPMIISMLVQALYNVVDSVFVSKISEDALTAVSIAFPMQNLMIAVSSGIGVGMNALLSRSLGERNFDRANRTAGQGIFLNAVGCGIFILLGIFAMDFFVSTQTGVDTIREPSAAYLKICCICSFGLFTQVTFERLLQSTGRTFYAMITQGTGAVLNIILDPILIFGLFGMPKLGVAGAAAATVIGQCTAGILAVFFNFKKNPDLQFGRHYLRPQKQISLRVLAIGVPSILMMSIGSVMTFAMNQILFAFSTTAVAVFGAYFKLQSFFFMPIFGLNNGMVPVVAFNLGAGKRDRMHKTIKYSMFYAVGIMLIGFAVFQLAPDLLLKAFDASEDMLAIGVPALRTISLSFLVAGFCVISGSACQALGKSMYSLWISLGRQLLALVPIAWLLSKTGNLEAVWLAFPLAEIVSLILSVLFLRKALKGIPWGTEAK